MKKAEKTHNNSGEFSLIISTIGDRQEAARLADLLVSQQVAACVSISSPVYSVYTWQGKIEHAEEFMLFIKAPARNYPLVEKLILEHHSYEVPEIIALPIVEGEKNYLEWLTGNSR
jgi:periplasmic divalent cation tolerance protein